MLKKNVFILITAFLLVGCNGNKDKVQQNLTEEISSENIDLFQSKVSLEGFSEENIASYNNALSGQYDHETDVYYWNFEIQEKVYEGLFEKQDIEAIASFKSFIEDLNLTYHHQDMVYQYNPVLMAIDNCPETLGKLYEIMPEMFVKGHYNSGIWTMGPFIYSLQNSKKDVLDFYFDNNIQFDTGNRETMYGTAYMNGFSGAKKANLFYHATTDEMKNYLFEKGFIPEVKVYKEINISSELDYEFLAEDFNEEVDFERVERDHTSIPLNTLIAEYIPENCKSKEFLALNPLFYEGYFYFPDVEKLKNRVLRTTEEYFDIIDGELENSDSSMRSASIKYYFFDAKGHITDVYEVGQVLEKPQLYGGVTHTTYEYYDDKISVTEKHYKSSNRSANYVDEKEYSITLTEDSLTLKQIKEEVKHESLDFAKDSITYHENKRDGSVVKKNVYRYDENRLYEDEYWKSEDILYCSKIYEAGCVIKLAYGEEYDCKIYDYVNSDSSSTMYIREYDDSGFLKQDDEIPKNYEGSYRYSHKELLDGPDRYFFRTFFE